MENIKYYVLGKKDNEMLSEYRNGYYDILLDKINYIKNVDLRNKLFNIKNDKDFILNCNNSSRIEYLYLNAKGESELFGHENIIKNFLYDIDFYEKNKKFYLNDSLKINGTNIYLSDFDRNPYNGLETHPDHFKSGTKVGFGIKDKEAWLRIYGNAFNALKEIDKGIYDELNFIIQKIVPIGTEEYIHNSASYKEAIGHLYMGLTTSNDNEDILVIQCLEALIHESSHNKLNLINKFDKLLLNDFELTYYSPYRPDARHIWGIFLGIHAFVPTIYTLLRFYKENNISDNNLLEKLVTYNTKNNLSLKVLNKYAKFTPVGVEIMEEVKYVMKLTNHLLKDLNIDSHLIGISKEKVVKHFTDVKNNYPYLKY